MDERPARKSALSAAEAPSPDGLATPSSPSVTNESNLPPIAADADDLKAIKTAVNDAASVGGGLWLSYLFVLFYLAVAAGAVTHADLFLENPVKLPFLNVELPLLAFFFLAPILFLFVHAYTLVHLVFLTDKAKRFDQALSAQIGEDTVAAKDADDLRVRAIAGVRGQLPSNIFIQFLAGPRDRRAGSFGWLLRVIAWSTLAVAPILLLLLFQLQFLPFHNSWVTWTHRLALVVDLVLIWWLWRKILSGREAVTPRPRAGRIWWAVGAGLTACAFLFSWGLATFPGEWQTESLAAWRPIHERDRNTNRIMVSVHDWLFESRIDDTTRRRHWLLSSTLVLPGFNIYEGLGLDDPEKAKWRDFVFRARGRDFKGAIFELANLPKVDFTDSSLQNSTFTDATVQGSSFDGANLEGSSLYQARLQGVSLSGATLWNAILNLAKLQGANLDFAKLQGAWLQRSELKGATLFNAELQGVNFDMAQLQGANLSDANLQGASLYYANLQGTSLANADLQGAPLQMASLEATDLDGALLWRTNALGEKRSVVARQYDVEPPHAINFSKAPENWNSTAGSSQWNDESYNSLRRMMDSLPAGPFPVENLIGRLDCASPDKTLAPCDPSRPVPPEAAAWQRALEQASVGAEEYSKALTARLRALVCAGDGDAVYILRGLLRGPPGETSSPLESRFGAVDFTLVDFIMSKDCLAFASLTDDDKSKLLRIKQELIEECEKRTGDFRRSRTFEQCLGADRARSPDVKRAGIMNPGR
jgi:uncharacterized protein YjbI with pentapeptide repeats